MAVTEPQRLDLHAAARTALGPEEGDTLMASLPPANTDIATRQDVERVEVALRTDLERLAVATKQDIERVEASLRKDIERVETSLQKDIERVETSLQKDIANGIAASEGRMRTYVWQVVVGTAVVLYIATLGTMLAGYAALSNSMQQMFMMLERS